MALARGEHLAGLALDDGRIGLPPAAGDAPDPGPERVGHVVRGALVGQPGIGAVHVLEEGAVLAHGHGELRDGEVADLDLLPGKRLDRVEVAAEDGGAARDEQETLANLLARVEVHVDLVVPAARRAAPGSARRGSRPP